MLVLSSFTLHALLVQQRTCFSLLRTLLQLLNSKLNGRRWKIECSSLHASRAAFTPETLLLCTSHYVLCRWIQTSSSRGFNYSSHANDATQMCVPWLEGSNGNKRKGFYCVLRNPFHCMLSFLSSSLRHVFTSLHAPRFVHYVEHLLSFANARLFCVAM